MSVKPAHRQAMVDSARFDYQGLAGITDLEMLKSVFCTLAERLKPLELLERAKHSAYPDELLIFLTEMPDYGRWDKFEVIAKGIYESQHYDFGARAVRIFADAYRSILVRERLIRGDYRRAWDEVRSAHRGFSTYDAGPGQPPHGGDSSEMAASIPTLHVLIGEIHQHMLREGLVPPIEHDFIKAPASIYRFLPAPKVAGWPFVVAIDGIVEKTGVNRCGQMVLAIIRRLNDERKKKRENRIGAKLAMGGM